MSQLFIRNPEAHELAEALAKSRGLSITEATIGALREALDADKQQEPLAIRAKRIADDLTGKCKGGTWGPPMTKEEIDDMWGQ